MRCRRYCCSGIGRRAGGGTRPGVRWRCGVFRTCPGLRTRFRGSDDCFRVPVQPKSELLLGIGLLEWLLAGFRRHRSGVRPILIQGENPAVHGGRESDTVLSNRRRLLTETQMLSTRRLVHVSKGCVGSRHLRGSTRRAETSVPSISGRRFPRVGSATDCGVRVVRQHGNPAYGSGKCDRTDRAVRHDRLRERRPEKPGVDDSLAGGSARDSATGRSRARDETRPTDLGREGPETCSVTGRVSSCGGSLAVYGEEDVTC